jgi:hypothetical protein
MWLQKSKKRFSMPFVCIVIVIAETHILDKTPEREREMMQNTWTGRLMGVHWGESSDGGETGAVVRQRRVLGIAASRPPI